MKIEFENIILRDYQLSDVEDEIRWTNVDTAWFYADTPWAVMEKADPDELRADMIEIMESMPENAIRWRFEIEVDGRHVGLVSSFFITKDFENTPWDSIDPTKNAIENNSTREIGIEICEMDCWGKGIGTKALTAFMEYYRSLGENHFIVRTWSGNKRMLGCAAKLGFTEIKRETGTHVVEGQACEDIVLEKWFDN